MKTKIIFHNRKKILKNCLMLPIIKLIDKFENIKMKKYQYHAAKEIVLTNSMKKIDLTKKWLIIKNIVP